MVDMQSGQPVDRSLDFHPTSLDDYIGQTTLKEKLALYTQAARMRQEPLDHLLLFGPPGLGKTTLAHIMAQTMGVNIRLCTGPTLERAGDLVSIVSSLEPRDILFIDEIHRMPTTVEEILYGAMEHFRVDVVIGQGAGARAVSLPIHPFTLVGATTKSGKLSSPFRTRFGIIERLDFYTDTELADIVLQAALHLGITIPRECALLIGKRSRGTPRIAKKIVRRIRDFAQVTNNNTVDNTLVCNALFFLGIHEGGLTTIDILLLRTILGTFNGGPVGLETLASLIGEDAETIESVYEPFLLRMGYVEKTSRGRQIPHTKIVSLKKKFLGQETIF